MSNVQVSVIVPIYNGEADLPELLAGLRSQSYPADRTELIIVDNASRDRTLAILKDSAEQIPNLQVKSENEIQSSYAARNTGIKAATGEILAFTDADCRPQPDWLENLVAPFSQPQIGIVAGEILAFPGNSLLEQYADAQETLSQKHTLAHPFCPYGQTANLAVRRQAFNQVGLFRPYLTTGGDADICWRILQQTEWQIEFAPNAIIRHRHRQTLEELRSQWQRYGRSNRYLHELHGVELMPELSLQDYIRRFSRWAIKELPINTLKTVLGKATFVDLLSTPLGLYTRQARSQGQRQAQLSEQARTIERL
ncbi:glycosyltransferase [Desertifilum sp. FACHB-1129]|uniref:Glycosyltransferase n=1 Tax=Desertifilum tharense IPPAS B-1220 TaxID=1781255 RepID=A0A1E5QE02_9CYAN|nr:MULTISPECIES: glycosyltransferase [Desertifilum]MDA0209052.1 glycosyltransferase [Cyanobacteria bacterium FC1]MBD2310534.1 glycosyltransferase [Desertifilum sp. FACHB-1129]MBD2321986.1 glycosyltransferase [Desertifilum sp. FACHB-866]MBD2332113.1 glycosyltransferase [Desertifilum sp. FACHB-868]OEJ72841.1 glycosyltransferase [Desertifilum tharense IPPAS B-1220]